jgi:hypothetical protein
MKSGFTFASNLKCTAFGDSPDDMAVDVFCTAGIVTQSLDVSFHKSGRRDMMLCTTISF